MLVSKRRSWKFAETRFDACSDVSSVEPLSSRIMRYGWLERIESRHGFVNLLHKFKHEITIVRSWSLSNSSLKVLVSGGVGDAIQLAVPALFRTST